MTSREKFEAWYLENWGHTEDDHETLFERCPDGDEYYRLGVRMAHEAWQASEASMAVQLANAESKCRELAAENVTLNDKMNKLATWPGIEFYSSSWEFCNLDGNDALEFMCDVQTPVTNDFLDEVRASELDILAGVAETMLVKFANQGASEIPEAKGWEAVRRQASQRAAKLRKGAAL